MARWHWPESLGGPRTTEQVRAILAKEARRFAEAGFGMWWWREQDSGELVGQVGLAHTTVHGEPAIEVGWSIAPGRWNQGFATEAAKTTLA